MKLISCILRSGVPRLMILISMNIFNSKRFLFKEGMRRTKYVEYFYEFDKDKNHLKLQQVSKFSTVAATMMNRTHGGRNLIIRKVSDRGEEKQDARRGRRRRGFLFFLLASNAKYVSYGTIECDRSRPPGHPLLPFFLMITLSSSSHNPIFAAPFAIAAIAFARIFYLRRVEKIGSNEPPKTGNGSSWG